MSAVHLSCPTTEVTEFFVFFGGGVDNKKITQKISSLNYIGTLSQVSFLWRPKNLTQRLLVERMTTLILCRATIVSKYILTSNLALQRVLLLLFF